jgi:hypothetical protein
MGVKALVDGPTCLIVSLLLNRKARADSVVVGVKHLVKSLLIKLAQVRSRDFF